MYKFMELFVTLVIFIVFSAVAVLVIALFFIGINSIVINLCEIIYTIKSFFSNAKE